MKINIYPLTSSLHEEKTLESDTSTLLKNLNKGSNQYKIVSSLDELYQSDLSLVLVRTGGSEGLFLKIINNLKPPIYLLSYGYNNSLAACIEILSYLNLHHIDGQIIHGSYNDIKKEVNNILKK